MRLISPSVHRRSAFTLTEILVVISIITLLAGLSFYAFESAKRFGDKLDSDTSLALAGANGNGPVSKAVRAPTAAGAKPAVAPAPRPQRVAGLYYVGFKAGVTDPSGTAQRLAGIAGGRVVSLYTNVIFGFGLRCNEANLAALRNDPAVQLVDQARYIYPSGVPLNIQRVYSNGLHGSQVTGAPINKVFGVPTSIYRSSFNTGVQGIVTSRIYLSGSGAQSTVAIMDTGIDKTHPDLNVVGEQDFTGSSDTQDLDGHGTHLAGVVGARDNTANGGVVGVYPGAPLINLKVMTNIVSTGTITNIKTQPPFGKFPGGNIVVTVSGPVPPNGALINIGGVSEVAPAAVFTDAVAGLLPAGVPPGATINGGPYQVKSVKFFKNMFELANTTGPSFAGNYTFGGTWTLVAGLSTDIYSGTNLNVYDALSNYVIPNARYIRVCLMGFEAPFDPTMNSLVDAAANQGVLMVAAAGNSGNKTNAKTTVSPAGASQAIVVGAIDDSNGAPGGVGYIGGNPPTAGIAGDDNYSVYSNTNVDFAAPGGNAAAGFYLIQSTIPIAGQLNFGLASPYFNVINGDNTGGGTPAAGTSFAAAHVAGMLALVTDPHTSMGFIVGNRAVPTFRLQMTNKAGAIVGLRNLTHQNARFHMISPLTGSAWVQSGGIPNIITPYTKTLFNDTVGGVPVANFYVNDSQAPTFLLPFPG